MSESSNSRPRSRHCPYCGKQVERIGAVSNDIDLSIKVADRFKKPDMLVVLYPCSCVMLGK